jgi:hypothetical protein
MARLVRLGAFFLVLAALAGCKQSLDLKTQIVSGINALAPVTLTLGAGAGGSVSPSGATQAYLNKPFTITATPGAGGYLFSDWTVTPAGAATFADSGSESTTVTITSGDASIQANFMLPANRLWVAIASSADGQHLAAAATNSSNGDQIYTSSNAGTTWTLCKASPFQSWACIASDSTGQYIAAGSSNPGNIYTSSDYGKSWTKQTQGLPDSTKTSVNWSSIASDSTGQYLVAAVNGGTIYLSSNRGASWAAVPDQPLPIFNSGYNTYSSGLPKSGELWCAVTSDCTGQQLTAAIDGGGIYASQNGGTTWYWSPGDGFTLSSPCLACATGLGAIQFKAAAGKNSAIYVANMPGPSTKDLWSGPYGSSSQWTAIASDATGSNLVATASGDSIYTLTWNASTYIVTRQPTGASSGLPSGAAWQCVASDGTGDKLVAGVNGGHIYCSSNQGTTWTLSL